MLLGGIVSVLHDPLLWRMALYCLPPTIRLLAVDD